MLPNGLYSLITHISLHCSSKMSYFLIHTSDREFLFFNTIKDSVIKVPSADIDFHESFIYTLPNGKE